MIKQNNSKPIASLITFISLFFFLIFTFYYEKEKKVAHETVEYKSHKEVSDVKIGVLAKRGKSQAYYQWGATADYLNERIKGISFTLVPLDFNEVEENVKDEKVDFLLVNSAMYINLEVKYGVSRLLTLKNLRQGRGFLNFGGVIFTRKDRDDINVVEDIEGKIFSAVSKDSFGGWHMAWKIFHNHGMNPQKDFDELKFMGTHDAVVYDVLYRNSDAGTVRTDTLERMELEELINPSDFKIIHQESNENFPFALSTELYPEWPFAKSAHISDDLAHKVALILMDMTPSNIAAVRGGVERWTVPQNYQPVHETLRTLRIAPYEDYGKISFDEIIIQYRWIILFIIFMLMIANILNIRLVLLKEKLADTLEVSKKMEKEAKDASMIKGQFLANMSHEIRTPLNAIIGLSSLMFKTKLSPKQLDYNKKINSSGKSLLGIINGILDYSKIEANKIELESLEFRMDEVLYNLSNMLTLKAEERKIELLFDISKEVPYKLIGDQVRLTQVLTNITGNAIKFTEEGQVVIRIAVAKKDDNSVTLQFEVNDTGVGMTEEQTSKLFTPFTQADSSTTRKFGGTGLGLSISKELIELMGGEISVDSKIGEGTSFYFTINFIYEKENSKELVCPKSLNKMPVLVIDDNEEARLIIKKLLESFDFIVKEVESGKEAIELLEEGEFKPKLIILDYLMPDLNGIETAEMIRKIENLIKVPEIMMISAYGRQEVKRKAEILGIDKFLDKPVNPSYLFDTIMEIFGEEREEFNKKEDVNEELKTQLRKIKGANILLVEDNKMNQLVAIELLTHEGFNVITADNGREAVRMLEKAAKDSFDIVLMDIQMPVMDGRTATRAIRNLSTEVSRLPIIAMTAHALSAEVEKNLESGMDEQINKPIDIKNLMEILVKYIEPKERENILESEVNQKSGIINIEIDGINTELGLKRVAGNQKLYKELLESFVKKYENSIEDIKSNIKIGDIKANEILIHSLKGISGNLGADELFEKARELELIFRVEKTDDVKLNLFKEELDRIISNMKNYLIEEQKSSDSDKESVDIAESEVYNNKEIKNEIIKLYNELKEFNSNAIFTVENLNNHLSGDNREALKELIEMINNLEFDKAIEVLTSYAEHHEIDLGGDNNVG